MRIYFFVHPVLGALLTVIWDRAVLQRQAPQPPPVLHCDRKFGSRQELVHIDCVSGGCDRHFKEHAYSDECCAEDKAGVVDMGWTCCLKK